MAASATMAGVSLTRGGSMVDSCLPVGRARRALRSQSTPALPAGVPSHLFSGHVSTSKETGTTQVLARCEAAQGDTQDASTTGRRGTLVGLSALAAAASVWSPPLFVGVDASASAADLTQRIQRDEYRGGLQTKLVNLVDNNPDLVSDLMRLALNDALSFDKASKTGGANGSIRFSDELARPENAGLEKAVAALGTLKEAFDAGKKGGPVAWADLIQFAGKAAVRQMFLNAAIAKAGGDVSKGKQLNQAFGSSAQWGQFNKAFGRTDATEADPANRVPAPDSSPAEWKEKFAAVGLKPRQVAVMSAFLGPDQEATEKKLMEDPEIAPWVKKYQRSRETVSQTDYEVDLITTLTKICVLGQSINYEAYTFKIPVKLRL
ncbi:hypothetical protein CBR_g39625 [Chara braunii]|uniref:Plant heme peroxidase family profile domain-containing protein n=1 Tax=Chara braunii TaxID=69332 RepID=A0A388K1C0_CHABU|nr:hypothetical protein CBR_g39625 [Chara braunii]|eukprot:GBG63840.1 hypothetical protein CBR_g39625 [Chara braunii]